MKYQTYPVYKDSGFEWLGEIPENWDITRIRFLARPGDKTFTDGDWIELPYITDDGVRLIQTGNIGVGEYKEQGFRFISEESFGELGCTEVLPNDVLICRLADPVGRACLAPEAPYKQITSVDVCILKTRHDVDPRFVVYFLSSKTYLGFVASMSRGGTRERISRSFLGSIAFPLPDSREQLRITSFLDAETAQIDTLIAKQERLIALLQEKRQALISHAVTKGLNPDAPMKESGVEWLGEVPKHWGVAAVWMLFRLGRGRVISNEEILDNPGPYPVYSSQTERDGVMGYLDTFDFEGDYITWTTDGANAGTVFYRSGRFNCTNVCGTLYPSRDDLYLPFFRHAINNATDRFVRQDINPKLMNNVMASIRVQIPPREEQISIMTFLDRETRQIDTLIEKAKAVIERLQERRTALISAAVTGKIDVRAAMN